MPIQSPQAGKPSGVFVAVGHQGQRLLSRDGGRKWEGLQLGKEGETYRAVAFGGGRCVAIGSYGGSNLFAVTTDGITWKTSTKDAQYSRYLLGLGYGKDAFVGIGGDPGSVGGSQPFVMTTADGEQWSELQPITGKHVLRRLAWGAGRFVAAGDRGRRAASTDGRTWQDAPEARANDTLVDVTFGKGIFVGVGLHGLRMTSADGLQWSSRLTGEEGEHLNAVVWTGDRFVAVGQGATYLSPDGLSWERRPNADAPLAVAYGDGVFVGANWKGRLLRSTDGVKWEQVHKCEHHAEAVAFGRLTG